MMEKVMVFLTQAPPFKRLLAGLALGVVCLAMMTLFTVYPNWKTLRSAGSAGAEQEKQVEQLKAEENNVRQMVQRIQEKLNAGKLVEAPRAKSSEDVIRVYQNLETAAKNSGVALTKPLDKPAKALEHAGDRVREYQPVNLEFTGNFQNVIWLFKEAADNNALPAVTSMNLSLNQASYPTLSGSIALRILVADYPAAAAPPGVLSP